METEDQSLIQDCDPQNLDPSPPQDEYAPVIFAQETVSHIVSIDMMSGKVRLVSLWAFYIFCFSDQFLFMKLMIPVLPLVNPCELQPIKFD